MNRALIVLASLAATAAAGCTVGARFEPPSYESLVLNQTTRQEVQERFGAPSREGTVLKNDHTLKAISYSHATGGSFAGGHGASVIPARAMTYFFLEDRLVAYDFASSYESDHTEFDDSKVPEVRKGETTRDQVVALFGPPKGKCAYPFIAGKGDEGIAYRYHQTSRKFLGGFNIYAKQLIVCFGPEGKVSAVEFTTSGEK
ncbi:MAG: hypothetical protein HY293_02875 [Planctomycetes bacterium]|nr:hypothetical protein [Planctomycetota bacterium]